MSSTSLVSLLLCFLSIVEIPGQGIGNFDFGQELILSGHEGGHFIDSGFGGGEILPQGNFMIQSGGNAYNTRAGRTGLSAPLPTTRTIRRVSRTSYPRSAGGTRIIQLSGNSQGGAGGLDLTGLLQSMMSTPGQRSFSWTIRREPQRTTQRRQQVRRQRIPDVFQSFGSQFGLNGMDFVSENPRTTIQRRINPPRNVIPALPTTSGAGGASAGYGLTSRHVKQMLAAHNNARRELGAADMHLMVRF